ncbi:MAG: outer membrane protein assembly factor BamA [Gemmatimonadota bacterium]
MLPRETAVSLRLAKFLAAGLLLGGLFLSPRPVVSQVADTLVTGAVPVAVDTILVRGFINFSEAALRGTIGISSGSSVTYGDIQEAERRLWNTGAFSDVQVTAREGTQSGSRVLTFWVEEHPVVRSYTIEGLDRVSHRDVWEHAELTPGVPYSPGGILRARQFIRDGLAERGVPFARVDERRVPIPGVPGEIEVVLAVAEVQRISLAEVVFNGNDAISDEDLRGVLDTKEEGFFWWQTGTFREDTLEEDLFAALPEFYASTGYLDFQVLGDTLVIDPTSGKARLEVDVREGPQYLVASFSVEGARRFPTQDLEGYYENESGGLLRTLGIRRGSEPAPGTRVFDQLAFIEASQRVQELYANEGYLYAQVTPGLERLPPAEEGESPRVALTWTIQEGQPVYVRRIYIEGNDYTHERIIRDRVLLLPGDVYSQERLIGSYQAISGLGFFETPLPFPEIIENPATNEVDIVFRVVEQQNATLNFGTTMGGQTGIAGFIGVDHSNIFGQAKAGSLRWDFGRYQNSFSVQYSDPAILNSRLSGTISIFDARDRFFSFATGDRKTRGVSTRVGFPVPGSFFARFYVGYSLSRTEYRLRGGVDDTSLFGRPPGTLSQISLGLARSTLDHPLFPTIGSEQSWTAEFNGGVLGGDGNYTKHRVELAWWVPVAQIGRGGAGARPIVTALGLRATAGAIFGNAANFPFDRFWMGGVQFGERLRGYEETTITPNGYFPTGAGAVREADRLGDAFLSLSAEYAIRVTDGVSISAFAEAGNIWGHPRDIDPTHLLRGAGLGIEMMTPFGPIGLDYAWGFDRTDGGAELHFRMGGQQGIF